MAQTGQAPEPAQNAGFLQKETVLKPYLSGTTTLQYVPSTGLSSVVVTHNLGFRPQVIASWVNAAGGTNQYMIPTILSDTAAGAIKYFLYSVSTTTATTFYVDVPTGSSIYASSAISFAITYSLLGY